MQNNKFLSFFIMAASLSLGTHSLAQSTDTLQAVTHPSRLVIGGYGEATYQYNMYSDNFNRYKFPTKYADDQGFGRVDIPHAVLMLGYDFGQGWSFGTEIEFEHGGVEAAVEIEDDEAGEFEKEIERGGEVALEQFWIQKSWSRAANLRMGHIVVPVGATNNAHLPTEYFGVFRPEGESTIIPCTWHETGVSFWGCKGVWRYELQLIPALNSSMFDKSSWANGASASAYEFRSANKMALAARIDCHALPHIRLSASGYVGNTFGNDILTYAGSRYADVKGTCVIGSLDMQGRWGQFALRANALYGHLSDAYMISAYNSSLDNSSNSPYAHTMVGEKAYALGCEMGYTLGQKWTPFVRMDAYDSYIPAQGQTDYQWTARQCVALGFNYRPIAEIIIKAEAGYRNLAPQYNDEPWVALGITWAGFFKK